VIDIRVSGSGAGPGQPLYRTNKPGAEHSGDNLFQRRGDLLGFGAVQPHTTTAGCGVVESVHVSAQPGDHRAHFADWPRIGGAGGDDRPVYGHARQPQPRVARIVAPDSCSISTSSVMAASTLDVT
jgi:hypothetical protein